MSKQIKPLASAQNLTVTINRTSGRILRQVSFELEKGKHICIMGESGSGKTTLVNCIADFDLTAHGLRVHSPIQINREKTKVFSVCQDADYFLDPYKTLYYYIKRAFTLRYREKTRSRKKLLDIPLLLEYVRCFGLLKPLFEDNRSYSLENLEHAAANWSNKPQKNIANILRHTLKSKTKQKLSGGEKQKFFLLLAFIVNPDILVADEIFTDIDEASRGRILSLIFKQQFTVVFISHSIGLVKKLMHQHVLAKVYYLRDKTFDPKVWQNAPGAVLPPWATKMIATYDRISHLQKHPSPHDPDSNQPGNGSEKFNIGSAHMTFRDGRKARFACRNGNIKLFHGINYAFVGENGAGKTTLFKILAKINHFKGEIFYLHNNKLQKLEEVKRLDFVYNNRLVFQKTGNAVDDNQPVIQYLESIFTGQQREQAPELIQDMVRTFFEPAKTGYILKRRFHELSVGQQRRVLLIRALLQVNSDSILFIDEAMRGMDVFLKEKLIKYIKDRSIQVFLVTHDSDLVKALCDRYVRLQYEKNSGTTYLSGPWSMETFNHTLGGEQ